MYAFYYYPQGDKFLCERMYEEPFTHLKKSGRFSTQYNSIVKEQNLLLLETNDPKAVLLALKDHPYEFKKDIKSFNTTDYPEYFI
jgi:hypothetical protein